MNRKNWEAMAIILGLIVMVGTLGYIFNGIAYKPEIKPPCRDIEMNDEWYWEHGHDDWVKECRNATK